MARTVSTYMKRRQEDTLKNLGPWRDAVKSLGREEVTTVRGTEFILSPEGLEVLIARVKAQAIADLPEPPKPTLEDHMKAFIAQTMIGYLREHLKLEITNGDFTDPNDRIVTVTLEGEPITQDRFSVRQTREYEG